MDRAQSVSKRVVVATGNPHKVAEIKTELNIDGWEFVALKELGDFPEPVEDADTFEGNARIKALAAHKATGLAAIADDSGLMVDALQGAPGVYSARYAGPLCNDDDNNKKLLEQLAHVPAEQRSARFVSTLVFIDDEGQETVARGTCEGHIGTEARGSGGFGYDPLFYLDCYNGERTMAQLTMEEKNAISHRGNALKALRTKLVGA